MIFATLQQGGRDGMLLIVSEARDAAVTAVEVAPTLQGLLDDWDRLIPRARQIAHDLNAGKRSDSMALANARLTAPKSAMMNPLRFTFAQTKLDRPCG